MVRLRLSFLGLRLATRTADCIASACPGHRPIASPEIDRLMLSFD
jgi:hypothetical protein